MTSMSSGSDYVDYLLELLSPLGSVRAKRMFGGHGMYLEDLMFGLVANDELYLKVDDGNRQAFEDRGLEPFTYMGKNKPVRMSYYHAPEEALEESEVLCDWARDAIAAALRARK